MSTKPRPKRNKAPQAKVLMQLAQDEEAIEFIKLNAPYLSMQSMETALEISGQKMNALVKMAGVDVSEAGKEPRAYDIAKELGFLPIGKQVEVVEDGKVVKRWVGGTVIEQWKHGTSFHLPSDMPGITRVTRHFAMGDE
jgi:hypothetical protein